MLANNFLFEVAQPCSPMIAFFAISTPRPPLPETTIEDADSFFIASQ
jgi:hypothetical protein